MLHAPAVAATAVHMRIAKQVHLNYRITPCVYSFGLVPRSAFKLQDTVQLSILIIVHVHVGMCRCRCRCHHPHQNSMQTDRFQNTPLSPYQHGAGAGTGTGPVPVPVCQYCIDCMAAWASCATLVSQIILSTRHLQATFQFPHTVRQRTPKHPCPGHAAS